MITAIEFLAGRPRADGSWAFAIGRERHGAFGGAFGGVVSACCVAAARSVAPDRLPASLDVNYVRGLPAGTARMVPSVVHGGRSLTTVAVDAVDEAGRLCTRATVKLVAPDALARLDHPGPATGPAATRYAEGTPWRNPPDREVPLITTFAPRAVGRDPAAGIATALRVPWDSPGGAAEAACLAADVCVGPPVAGAFERCPTPTPTCHCGSRRRQWTTKWWAGAGSSGWRPAWPPCGSRSAPTARWWPRASRCPSC